MTQLGPAGEDECAGQTDAKMMRKIKKEGEKQGKIQRRGGSGGRGL